MSSHGQPVGIFVILMIKMSIVDGIVCVYDTVFTCIKIIPVKDVVVPYYL